MSTERSPQQDAFDAATDNVREINEQLAETDGRIAVMSFDGAIGYHHYIAAGETDPEYLWKVALLKALDDTVLEMAYVDADSVEAAADQLDQQLRDAFDPLTREYLIEQFEGNLRDLKEVQEGQR